METSVIVASISILCNLVFGVIGYLMRTKMENMEESLKAAHELITEVRLNYVLKADIGEMRQELQARFDRLEALIEKVR